MKRNVGLVAMVLVCLFVGTSAFAAVIGNVRPVTVGVGDSPSLFGTGGALEGHANPTQLGYDYFNPTTPSAGPPYVSEFSLQFEIAGHKNGNQLSLYSLADTTKELIVFPGADNPGSGSSLPVNVTFTKTGAGWTLESYYALSPHATIDTEYFSSISFGFVLEYTGNTDKWAYNGQKFYGDDEMNNGNAAQMLVFNALGVNQGYYFAFEDTNNNLTDHDFNDMIFHAQSIEPVPEPGTMLLLGSGLVGLAGWGRKKFRK